jgi:hypothetical protein
MNSWDVELEVRALFKKIIHIRALLEMFENKKHNLHDNFLTV